MLLSSAEHLLRREQPGVRLFRLLAPGGLTHSQALHQILPTTYPVSCITVLKSLFWARREPGTHQQESCHR